MSGEIHDWLAELRDGDPAAARVVVRALAALLNEGARLGEPLVLSTAKSWPWALFAATRQLHLPRLIEFRRHNSGDQLGLLHTEHVIVITRYFMHFELAVHVRSPGRRVPLCVVLANRCGKEQHRSLETPRCEPLKHCRVVAVDVEQPGQLPFGDA